MSDAVKRAARTFAQAFVGTIVASGVLSAVGDDGVIDFSDVSTLGKAAVAAVTAGLVAVVSFVQNALEDNTSFPTVGK